ncbi:MAG: MerR family transcriptional regulator [Myxococcota bacterium]
MKQVAEKTGLSPATVNYYFRMGLLPPREKPARNSAVYTEAHVERLKLIRRLREEGGGLPLVAIRRILELVEHGVDPSVALELHRGVVGPATSAADWSTQDGARDVNELAERSGAPKKLLNALIRARVIAAAPGADPVFDSVDIHAAKMFSRVLAEIDAKPKELGAIASHIFAAVDGEMAIRNRATKDMEPQDAAVATSQLTDVANFWHAYLFMRARQHGIAMHGLGAPKTKPKRASRRKGRG